MKKNTFKRFSSLILIAAMIMTLFAGCAKSPAASENSSDTQQEATSNTIASSDEKEEAQTKTFTFFAVDKEGNESKFEITTDKETVGEALVEAKLIEGNVSDYGLYVTKVNGIEAIYEVDGSYWAFYVNGEYATKGVDLTEVEDGATYAFKVEG